MTKLEVETVATFQKRANTWEREEGELGKIVASELRMLTDTFSDLLDNSEITKAARAVVEAHRYNGDDGWDRLKNAIAELEGKL